MKKLLLILPLFILFFSCEKDDVPDNNNITKLDTPNLEAPLNGADIDSTSSTYNFSWSAVNNAVTYEFEIADNANFTNSGKSIINSNNTSIASSDLQTGNTYYWKVRALAPNFTTSEFSQSFSFNYISGSGGGSNGPSLLTPSDNATVNTTRPTFTWSNTPLVGASYYIIQFAADFTFNSIVYTGQSVPTSFTVPSAIDPLAPYSTIFWRVSADGGSTYSDYFTLNIQ